MNIKLAREDLRRGKTIYDMPLNVAFYARVSTDKSDQLNSLENQSNYFKSLISDNKCWTFAGSYIDEGISGTAVKNRDNFLRMIEDASLGKIDMILTKEISRFSRNTVDSIKYTEYLLKKGVIVYFISDNLNTIQEDSEFRLTIMSSLAQDEVRKLSERVKFGIRRMIVDKKLIGGNLTGYYKKNGKYEINPHEAIMIEYLFNSVATGKKSLTTIGKDLEKMGYINSKGKAYSSTTLSKMLQNKRYKGYYTAHLTEVEDYKTHKKRRVPLADQISYKDTSIPAIVSEDLWNRANDIYQQRKKQKANHILNSQKHLDTYKYTSKLYCKHCNCHFVRSGGSNRSNNPIWICNTYKREGVSKCQSPNLNEKYLDEIFIHIITSLFSNKNNYRKTILEEYEHIIKHINKDTYNNDLNNNLKILNNQKDKLLDLSLKNMITDEEFKKKNNELNNELKKLKEAVSKQTKDETFSQYITNRLNRINNTLKSKLNIKENLAFLVQLLIKKVEIEKINNDRKKVKLTIYFNFDKENVIIKSYFNKKNFSFKVI